MVADHPAEARAPGRTRGRRRVRRPGRDVPQRPLAAFGPQLGKKTRLDGNLRRLVNHGFIGFRNDEITEGPLLDLLLDYDTLAPRMRGT